MESLVVGTDGLARCGWSGTHADYVAYHDEEWGRPVSGEVELFERLTLEAFQSGLSWLTILRKRDGFRRAFAGFDPATVAGYGGADIDRLLADAAIVRNRKKIEATITNAGALAALHAAGGTLRELIWSARSDGPAPASLADLPSSTAASRALAGELKRHGFAFVGPTTAYAGMQACGVVNDHLAGCHVRTAVEEDRSAAPR